MSSPGQPWSVRRLGHPPPFFSPLFRAAWALTLSPSSRKTSDGIPGIQVSWRAGDIGRGESDRQKDRQTRQTEEGVVWVWMRWPCPHIPSPTWPCPATWHQGTEMMTHPSFNQRSVPTWPWVGCEAGGKAELGDRDKWGNGLRPERRARQLWADKILRLDQPSLPQAVPPSFRVLCVPPLPPRWLEEMFNKASL